MRDFLKYDLVPIGLPIAGVLCVLILVINMVKEKYEVTYQCGDQIETKIYRSLDKWDVSYLRTAPFYVLITDEDYKLIKTGLFIGETHIIKESSNPITIKSIYHINHKLGRIPCPWFETKDLRVNKNEYN